MWTEHTGDAIPVAFCASEEYLDLVQTALWSILLHRESERPYRAYILCMDMAEELQARFRREMAAWDGAEIIFLDVSAVVRRYVPDARTPVKETLFSLLLPELLSEEKRVITLDSDLIVCRDLEELFETDMDGAFLAAAPDPDFIGQYNSGNPEYRRYYRDVVPLSRPYGYFQGGVYVLDLEALRGGFPPGKLFTEAAERRYRYDDQDVLNLYCAGQVKTLDMRWNVLYDSLGYRRKYIIDLAPVYIREAYDEARRNPWIIHYAGGERPWNDENCDLACEFWKVADQAPAGARLRERMDACRKNSRKKPLEHLLRASVRYLRYVIRRARTKTRQQAYGNDQKAKTE